MQKKVVIIGGPGTGKSSVLNNLIEKGFHCFPEVSREVTLEAKKQGIDQLFLTEPLLFSEKLLEGREKQYNAAEKLPTDLVFFDRGLPDVFAYLNYSKTPYPNYYIEKSKTLSYTHVFLFLPWREIYISDNERYESFDELLEIDTYLQEAYTNLGYNIVTVPFGSIDERTDFIINWLKLLS